MKVRTFAAMFACMFAASICCAQTKDAVLLVKITDYARKTSYEVQTPEEYKALQKRVTEEAKYFKRAMEMAEKAWRQNEALKKDRFQSTAVFQRKVQTIGQPFADRSKAADKMISYTDKERERDREAQEELNKVYAQIRKNEGLEKKDKPKVQIEDEKKAALQEASRQAVIDNINALIESGGKTTEPVAVTAPAGGEEEAGADNEKAEKKKGNDD